jgi:hypothetical protein
MGIDPSPPWAQEPMDGAEPSSQADRVPRVVIFGSQPQHLSAAESNAWLCSELGTLRGLPGVESVVLTRVQDSPRYSRPWAWLCELHLADGADPQACAEHPLCRDWLMDLRLLGMRPALAILGAGERVI